MSISVAKFSRLQFLGLACAWLVIACRAEVAETSRHDQARDTSGTPDIDDERSGVAPIGTTAPPTRPDTPEPDPQDPGPRSAGPALQDVLPPGANTGLLSQGDPPWRASLVEQTGGDPALIAQVLEDWQLAEAVASEGQLYFGVQPEWDTWGPAIKLFDRAPLVLQVRGNGQLAFAQQDAEAGGSFKHYWPPGTHPSETDDGVLSLGSWTHAAGAVNAASELRLSLSLEGDLLLTLQETQPPVWFWMRGGQAELEPGDDSVGARISNASLMAEGVALDLSAAPESALIRLDTIEIDTPTLPDELAFPEPRDVRTAAVVLLRRPDDSLYIARAQLEPPLHEWLNEREVPRAFEQLEIADFRAGRFDERLIVGLGDGVLLAGQFSQRQGWVLAKLQVKDPAELSAQIGASSAASVTFKDGDVYRSMTTINPSRCSAPLGNQWLLNPDLSPAAFSLFEEGPASNPTRAHFAHSGRALFVAWGDEHAVQLISLSPSGVTRTAPPLPSGEVLALAGGDTNLAAVVVREQAARLHPFGYLDPKVTCAKRTLASAGS